MATETAANKRPSELQFNFLKSNFFRVAHVDGAVGNITPKGDIFVSFYNERVSLPDSVINRITEDGRVGEQISANTSSPGLIREMEFGIVLDVEVAKNLNVWLSNMIGQVEGIVSARTDEEKKNDDA